MRLSCLLALCWALTLGCGIKSVPIESDKLVPMSATELEARPVPEGVEVSFRVPGVDKPEQKIEEARLYYGYLPVAGDPACPPCPPRLTKMHTFDLGRLLPGLEGGQFAFLDTQAPQDMQAVYEVVLVDAAGRKSRPSHQFRAYRVTPPAMPQGLSARQGEGQVELRWQAVATLQNGDAFHEPIGYLITRKGPDGERMLSERPQSTLVLVDKTVMVGQTYSYRVAAVRTVRDGRVIGAATPWASASTRDEKAPKPATGLVGVSQEGGVYLRFTPSPDQDTAGYFLERQDKKGGPWSRLNKAPLLENTFVDKDVQPKGVYIYRVVAVDEAGNESRPSQAAEVKHQP